VMQKVGPAVGVILAMIVLWRLFGTRRGIEPPPAAKTPIPKPPIDADAALLREMLEGYLADWHADGIGEPLADGEPESYRIRIADGVARLRGAAAAPSRQTAAALWHDLRVLAEALDQDHRAGRWQMPREGRRA
jgi:hypothetical protein